MSWNKRGFAISSYITDRDLNSACCWNCWLSTVLGADPKSQWIVSVSRCLLTDIGIAIIKIILSRDRFIFTTGISIHEQTVLSYGQCPDIKMPSYHYKDPHYKNKTISGQWYMNRWCLNWNGSLGVIRPSMGLFSWKFWTPHWRG